MLSLSHKCEVPDCIMKTVQHLADGEMNCGIQNAPKYPIQESEAQGRVIPLVWHK